MNFRFSLNTNAEYWAADSRRRDVLEQNELKFIKKMTRFPVFGHHFSVLEHPFTVLEQGFLF